MVVCSALKHCTTSRVPEILEDALQLHLRFTGMANFTFEGSLKALFKKQRRLTNESTQKTTSHRSPQDLDGHVMCYVRAWVCIQGRQDGHPGEGPLTDVPVPPIWQYHPELHVQCGSGRVAAESLHRPSGWVQPSLSTAVAACCV